MNTTTNNTKKIIDRINANRDIKALLAYIVKTANNADNMLDINHEKAIESLWTIVDLIHDNKPEIEKLINRL